MPMNEMQKYLFKNAMHGNWEEVIKIYEQNREAHTAKITRSGDTAIHIAISDGQELVVHQLVKQLVSNSGNPSEALGIRNEQGKTPLHLAASSGNVAMCKCIAEQDPKLMGVRDKEDETPFFLAVRHGRKEIFLCLHNLCNNGDGFQYCRRKDGETILHSAIAGEYFDLAFQIIYLYEKLVNSLNEAGLSPLHLLASKPSAFRSGSHIRGFRQIIYHCIIVDKLEQESNNNTLSEGLQYNEASAKYPENYQTCVGFALFLRNLTRMLLGYGNHRESNNQISDAENPKMQKARENPFFPSNYLTCFLGLKLISKSMLVILGLGSREIVRVRERKEKHTWSVQVMEELLVRTSMYEYEADGRSPHHLTSIERDHGETTPYLIVDGDIVNFRHDSFIKPIVHDDHDPTSKPRDSPSNVGFHENGVRSDGKGKREGVTEMEKKETPILIAAKKGVVEVVERMLELLPIAIHDTNTEKKNVVLLAVEHRQPHVYSFLLGLRIMRETIFRQTDMDGNSALHLAAKLGDHRAWLIPGAALQMQWEIKWYEFVKNSMPPHFFVRYNKHNQSPKELFSHSHQNLVEEGGRWLTKTSESCSVVAALIATVAFATSATVPGGVKQESGIPTLEGQTAFSIFAISSLVALSFSVTSVVMFLSILTSRYQEKDFGKDLPRKLLLGLTSLFMSIASMLLSFCAGHFFVLKDKLKYAAFPVYAVSCLPVTLFAMAQFPLYFDLVQAMFKKVPHRSST
ncbi:uncharacterized protein LOC142504626 [Primulina tabacum]|uniref:uncharacterized protein LOC142504626 n=1 Tax=Primulina tabacum TaxID=48773 RepID=UPI003F5A958A